jgi:hypothetical protein
MRDMRTEVVGLLVASIIKKMQKRGFTAPAHPDWAAAHALAAIAEILGLISVDLAVLAEAKSRGEQ